MPTKRELKRKAQALSATAWIGKNGLDYKQIAEINKQLKTRKLVKIKLQKAFVEGNDRKKVALELAEKTKSELIAVVGFVIVLHKR